MRGVPMRSVRRQQFSYKKEFLLDAGVFYFGKLAANSLIAPKYALLSFAATSL
jgi:hypothetical protein